MQTVSTIASCVLGLMTHPEVLKKAQQDIDAVIGLGQLPGFEDEESLPYITAIVKETLRWREVTPICRHSLFMRDINTHPSLLAIPHLVDIEDEYKGYRIPAGSTVLPNTWYALEPVNVVMDIVVICCKGHPPRRSGLPRPFHFQS